MINFLYRNRLLLVESPNSLRSRQTPLSWFAVIFLAIIGRVTAEDLSDAVRIARENHQRHIFEFVSPQYKGSMLHDMIVGGLSSQFYNDPEMKQTKNLAAKIYGSALRSEDQIRKLELAQSIQLTRSLSSSRTVNKDLRRAEIDNSKAIEQNAKIELYEKTLEAEKAKYKYQQESLDERLKNKLLNITKRIAKGQSDPTGNFLNELLESMFQYLHYGYTLENDERYAKYLDKLTLDPSDFAKIQLKLDVSGTPVTFAATEGSGSLGQPPLDMRKPAIASELLKVQTHFAKLAKMKPNDEAFIRGVEEELPAMLDELERVSIQELGTKQAAAQRGGFQEMDIWKKSFEYRMVLRSLATRLRLESSPDILHAKAKYDPFENGNKLLPFLNFVVSNGCRFAEAKPGNEPTYKKLQSLMLQCKEIIED